MLILLAFSIILSGCAMPEIMVPPGGTGAPSLIAGPGGCSSPESCQSYCISNMNECRIFCAENPMLCPGLSFPSDIPVTPSGETITETPGNCQNEEECREYCGEHPEECGEAVSGYGVTGPGGCTTAKECEAYCRLNPVLCEGFG